MFKRSKIAIFSLLDTPAFGGAEQYLFSHLQFLSKNGYEIVLATNNKVVKKEIFSRLTKKEQRTFHIIKLPYRLDAIGNWKGLVKFFINLPIALVWCFNTLRRLKKEYQQVICLWPGFSDRLVFSPLAKLFNLSLIWIEIGPLEPTFKRNWGFPRLLYQFSEQFPNHIVTISQFSKKSILKNTHFREKNISLVYPGTRLYSRKVLGGFRKKAIAFRKEENIVTTKPIGVVARLADENEVDMVLRAFSEYVQKHFKNDVKLLIIGDGPQRHQLQKLARSLQITNRVHFLGFVSEEEKRIILSTCSFFIFPRAWELDGFGMTTIEAMSLGLPALTTDFGPQIEIVTNGKEGFRYKPHNSKDLAKYIEKMMKLNFSKRSLMSRNALVRATYFSELKSHQLMISVIEKLAIFY